MEKSEEFRDKVVIAFNNVLNKAEYDCSHSKIVAIMLHNQLFHGISLEVKVKKKTFVTQVFSVIKDVRGFINWLCGYLHVYSPFLIGPMQLLLLTARVEHNAYDWSNPDIRHTTLGKLEQFKTKYEDDKIHISDLKFDCLAPNYNRGFKEIRFKALISYQRLTISILLNNNRFLFYLLKQFGKFNILVNQFKYICNSLEGYLLVCNLLAPIVNLSYDLDDCDC